MLDDLPFVEAKTRQEWRSWLESHFDQPSGIWLVIPKKGSDGDLVYAEVVEEALCFGWVDSMPRTVDDRRYRLLLAPRKPKSAWSRLNKERVERLIAEGKMTPAGLAKIEEARRNGAWGSYDAIEELSVPSDLIEALGRLGEAQSNFEAFAPSAKKAILWWIESAKAPETRAKRIAETAELAAQNRKAGPYQFQERRAQRKAVAENNSSGSA